METIAIVGAGAGGFELATRRGDSLGKSGHARMVLVDRYPTHFWKPLHTVAAGKLHPQGHQVEYAAQAANHSFQFICDEVLRVDRSGRTLDIGSWRKGDPKRNRRGPVGGSAPVC